MKASKYAPPRRPRCLSDAEWVTSAIRLQLCAVAETPEVQTRHLAALLAFTPTVVRVGNEMRVRFEHGPTALWLTQTMARRDVELVDVGCDGGTVVVLNPQILLGRYGFREGRWVFGQGTDAALGISRGAVHAAATFNRHGMKVACPNAPMMLTLTAVMSRLGINAKPTDGEPRAAISAGDVPGALARLGVPEVAAQYRGAMGVRS
jgi:hypothetical protein